MRLLDAIRGAFSKKSGDPQKPSARKKFVSFWADIFRTRADVFTGLYSGMLDISNGKLKRQSSLLKEWSERVENSLDTSARLSSAKYIVPMINSSESEKVTLLAKLLISAAAEAGLSYEKNSELVITEMNSNDYSAINSDEALEEGDVITVLKPAWYSGGRLLETGFAELKDAD